MEAEDPLVHAKEALGGNAVRRAALRHPEGAQLLEAHQLLLASPDLGDASLQFTPSGMEGTGAVPFLPLGARHTLFKPGGGVGAPAGGAASGAAVGGTCCSGSVELTVLGKSPSWQDAGGACTSYLVAEGPTALLVDFGSGALAKLRARMDYRDVDAIVISHFHADHLLDLIPLACALTYGPASRDGTTPPRLIAPRGAREFLAGLSAAIGDADLLPNAFPLEEYEPSSRNEIGDVVVATHPVPHVGPTHAIELIAPGGNRVVFGADGPYSEELIAAARGADVLLAEATLADPEPSPTVHMSASETGRLAREAGVERLVLTHISDELDLERSRRTAAEEFGGEVEIAAEGAVYEV